MRTMFALSVFWTLLLSLALASPLAKLGIKPGIKHLDIATPERVAKAKEMVEKRYREEAERIAQGLLEKSASSGEEGVRHGSRDFQAVRTRCDSDEGQVSPFHHQFMDFGNVRIAVCNWGLTNPCHSSEMDAAWEALALVCPDQGSESAGDATISGGMWYRSSWLKGYFRSNCTTGDLCDGDRTGIECRNEG
ncbi:hypothetical protein PG988_006359 [Apiospora saccharicola]